jgi:hypothetical protein
MERYTDLSIILKSFPYQERDRIVVCLTENHGKVTGLAKGGIYSRRFGGTLDFLACSRIHFTQKPHAEMASIDSASIHHEFANLHKDFSQLTATSFAAEFCLKILESHAPYREMFWILSNMLFHVDTGMPWQTAVNTFLCKSFFVMGYAPSADHPIYLNNDVDEPLLTVFLNLTTTPFKKLATENYDPDMQSRLFQVLSEFMLNHFHVPASGFKSWRLLTGAMEPLIQSPQLPRDLSQSL